MEMELEQLLRFSIYPTTFQNCIAKVRLTHDFEVPEDSNPAKVERPTETTEILGQNLLSDFRTSSMSCLQNFLWKGRESVFLGIMHRNWYVRTGSVI
jgi:hypothetical protein